MLLDINEPSVTREVAGLISSLLSNLDGMQVWLKMDAGNICVNSSAGDNFMILKEGDPARLPADRGIYRNWGGYTLDNFTDSKIYEQQPSPCDLGSF